MRTGRVYALYDVRRPGDYRYVGRTVTPLSRRLWRHRRAAVDHPDRQVARWVGEAGPHNVRIAELGEYPEQELSFWECHWIAAFSETGFGLANMMSGGGRSGFPTGYYRHSPETRALISARKKGKPSGSHWQGKKRSEETKRKIAEGMRRAHAEGRH